MVAAVGSWLDARAHGGRWLVRMDDLDPPREQPGAVAAIFRTLERFQLEPDGEPVYQSQRSNAYAAVLERLQSSGDAYGCACSRRELGEAAVYPGTCRGRSVEAGRGGLRWGLARWFGRTGWLGNSGTTVLHR